MSGFGGHGGGHGSSGFGAAYTSGTPSANAAAIAKALRQVRLAVCIVVLFRLLYADSRSLLTLPRSPPPVPSPQAASRREAEPERTEHELAVLARLKRQEEAVRATLLQRRHAQLSAQDPADRAALVILEANGISAEQFQASDGACATDLSVFQVPMYSRMEGLSRFPALRRLEIMLQKIPAIEDLAACPELELCVSERELVRAGVGCCFSLYLISLTPLPPLPPPPIVQPQPERQLHHARAGARGLPQPPHGHPCAQSHLLHGGAARAAAARAA